MKATISSKGQIVLPAEIRRRDDIKPGEEFDIERLDQGEYSLTRKTRRRNRGLVQILLNCPVKGWYKPMERMTYLKISAMFASVLCMLASTQTTAGQGEFSRTIPYPNPQAASSGPHLLLPFDGKIVLLTDPPDSKVYVMDGLDGSVILEFLIPPNSTPDMFESFFIQAVTVGNVIAISNPRFDGIAEDAGRIFLFDGTTGGLLKTIDNPHPPILNPSSGFAYSLTTFNGTIFAGSCIFDPWTYIITGNTRNVYAFEARQDSPRFGELVGTLPPRGSNSVVFAPPFSANGNQIYCLEALTFSGGSITTFRWLGGGRMKPLARQRIPDILAIPAYPFQTDFIFRRRRDPIQDFPLLDEYVLFRGASRGGKSEVLLQIDAPTTTYPGAAFGEVVATSGNYILINGSHATTRTRSLEEYPPNPGVVLAFDGRLRGTTNVPAFTFAPTQDNGRFGRQLLVMDGEIYITSGDAIYVYQGL